MVQDENNSPKRTMVQDKKRDPSSGELSEMNANEGLNHSLGSRGCGWFLPLLGTPEFLGAQWFGKTVKLTRREKPHQSKPVVCVEVGGLAVVEKPGPGS